MRHFALLLLLGSAFGQTEKPRIPAGLWTPEMCAVKQKQVSRLYVRYCMAVAPEANPGCPANGNDPREGMWCGQAANGKGCYYEVLDCSWHPGTNPREKPQFAYSQADPVGRAFGQTPKLSATCEPPACSPANIPAPPKFEIGSEVVTRTGILGHVTDVVIQRNGAVKYWVWLYPDKVTLLFFEGDLKPAQQPHRRKKKAAKPVCYVVGVHATTCDLKTQIGPMGNSCR